MFLGFLLTEKSVPHVSDRWMVAKGEVPAVKLMMWPVPPVVVVVGPKLTMSPMWNVTVAPLLFVVVYDVGEEEMDGE